MCERREKRGSSPGFFFSARMACRQNRTVEFKDCFLFFFCVRIFILFFFSDKGSWAFVGLGLGEDDDGLHLCLLRMGDGDFWASLSFRSQRF